MIREAAITLINLKNFIERISEGQQNRGQPDPNHLDVNTGWRMIRNNRQPNGIEMTPEITRAQQAFLAAAEQLASGGDVIADAMKDKQIAAREADAAMARLRDYRTALRAARGRDDARIIHAVDEIEVDDPF